MKVELTPQEEADQLEAWAASKAVSDVVMAAKTALKAQVVNEKADLPTWAQVTTAIENAFPIVAQSNIIKKIARPVYTILKHSVD